MKKIIVKNNVEFAEEVCCLYEALFHNANGYIGVRGCLEEGVPDGWDTMRGTYINGFYDIIPMRQAENLCNFVEEKQIMLNVVDTQTIYLRIDGEEFTLSQGIVKKNSRILNMEEGYTARDIIWCTPSGKEVSIFIKRMTSFEERSLFTIEYSVTPMNFEGEISFRSYHISTVSNYCNPNDPRMAAESEQYLHPEEITVEDGSSYVLSKTTNSCLYMCSAVTHKMMAEEHGTGEIYRNGSSIIYENWAHAKTGETVSLRKYTVITDSVRELGTKKAAKEILARILKKDLSYYYGKQQEYLARFWNQTEMEIEGDDAMNQAVSFNMYQLLQSAARDSYCNIAAKGLSGEGYEGHYFWDTEMFMLPFFTLTNPRLAKLLLSYRYDTLNAARENAGLLGHKKGALYPWRTITGVECSGYYPSGTAQYHIDGDIAYAIVSYYQTTGDMDFIVEKGAEIIFETARLWMDVGNYSDGRFVINGVTGPDEYTCMINNNYYTNCCAKYNLEWAVKFYEKMEEMGTIQSLAKKIELYRDEIEQMKEAAATMYLPYDEKLGINPQDDSFLNKPVWDLANTPKELFPLLLHYHPLYLYRYQVCKQADTVLAYFLFEDEQSKEVMERGFKYYERITTHDSSLSACVFSIVASRLGMKEKAYSYFGDSAKLDSENTHNNTKDGIHTANMGGCYMAIVNGFAGLKIRENGVSIAPFLPEAWNSYSFKFRYQGKLLKVAVRKDAVEISLEEGDEVDLTAYGTVYHMDDANGKKISIQNI